MPLAPAEVPCQALPTAANTHSYTPWPPLPAPKACSPGLPLSLCLPTPGSASSLPWGRLGLRLASGFFQLL